ncbi:MAG: hypothetical protein HY690_02645 [Chloroflexi bacterium]|nr:hypothetical protein [Chloroflexota bacterium]
MSGAERAQDRMGDEAAAMSARARGYQGGEEATIPWEQWGRPVERTASLARIFAVAVGAALAARAIVGLWRWLRRPPGG